VSVTDVQQKPRLSWATSAGVEHDGERVVPAASTIKIFIASAFWRSPLDPSEPAPVEPTPWSLSDQLAGTLTLGDLALFMLVVSDNAATNAILDRLGFDAVNDEIARLGLGSTVLRRKMIATGEENLTCARDLALGLARVASEQPRIVHALTRAQDSLLPSLIPDVAVAVKTGNLPSAYHEVAYLGAPPTGLAIAVCSSPPVLPDRVARAAAELAIHSNR
jgi:beta-lactamase class A